MSDETAEVDPFNCPQCGAHDYGLNRPKCPHCGYTNAPTMAQMPRMVVACIDDRGIGIPLRVGVKEEDGRIVDVGPYRHYVIWAGSDKRSPLSYCNNCGEALCIGPEEGPDFCICGAPVDEKSDSRNTREESKP